ncbi:Vacuolar protein sorting-associated protein 51 homolog [Strongyloides ratti]|uniref:Vacuolar protein sorting-associated protein 51 homolog n=1 Tax=Strongyloides ratti TaxID=34506 RepID=A0A090L933_STRRB|nr:Vacuolar protein sorting-associated protein 51 homolog [Strongyloides ratti]CEF66281.1 Vacuolar protein sorting-associated protein 51 homolog [Strongyloides ratti]
MADNNPLNISSPNFDVDAYMSELSKRKTLDELISLDEQMIFSVRKLDGEMQQLVYENYNKFLTAVGTVKEMKKEFSTIDDQMCSLSNSIKNISTSTKHLCNVFGRHREIVKKLTDQNKTIKSLQCIFTLPDVLRKLIDNKDYKNAVLKYLTVKEKLDNFKDHQSIKKIYDESMERINELIELLQLKLLKRITSEEEFTEIVQLLERLGVNTELLSNDVLKVYKEGLNNELNNLETQVNSNSVYFDVLEFVDNGVCSFLNNLSTIKILFSKHFKINEGNVLEFADEAMTKISEIILKKFLSEKETSDSVILVRAMDRVYRKVCHLTNEPTNFNYVPLINGVIEEVLKYQIVLNYQNLVDSMSKSLLEMRNDLSYLNNFSDFSNILTHWEENFLMIIKNTLANLSLFTSSDVTFSNIKDHGSSFKFIQTFPIQIRDGILLPFISELCSIVDNYISGKDPKTSNVSPIFYILLAKFLQNFREKHLNYLLNLSYDTFRFEECQKCSLVEVSNIENMIALKAESILHKFVSYHGFNLSLLFVKSIESKDWTSCPESRGESRSVVKRVMEQFLDLNNQVKYFVEDNDDKVISDNLKNISISKKHLDGKYDTTSSYTNSVVDKLFAEKIDFLVPLEFKKSSIMTGVVNIFLKSTMEAVRLETFSKNGYSQMQVDCQNLKSFFIKFVNNPTTLDSYFDEILSAVISRLMLTPSKTTSTNPFD